MEIWIKDDDGDWTQLIRRPVEPETERVTLDLPCQVWEHYMEVARLSLNPSESEEMISGTARMLIAKDVTALAAGYNVAVDAVKEDQL